MHTLTVATLTFATCDIRRCMNVNIRDEEPDEVIMFTLMSTPGLDPRIIISTGNDSKFSVNPLVYFRFLYMNIR